jgi:hypothetical protein
MNGRLRIIVFERTQLFGSKKCCTTRARAKSSALLLNCLYLNTLNFYFTDKLQIQLHYVRFLFFGIPVERRAPPTTIVWW